MTVVGDQTGPAVENRSRLVASPGSVSGGRQDRHDSGRENDSDEEERRTNQFDGTVKTTSDLELLARSKPRVLSKSFSHFVVQRDSEVYQRMMRFVSN